jgi:hypothetical protein
LPCALEDADERTARHKRLCAELADLAMTLARAVAARALTEWTEPQEIALNPSPAPEITPNLAPAAPCPRPSGLALRAPTCKSIDPALLFTRLAATVRDCIALEARLAAGPAPTSRTLSLALRADPRATPLREIFNKVTENHPDRAALRRDIAARVDQTLAADPGQTIEPPEIFFTICDELGIDIDLAILPDKYLDFITGPTAPPEPCATSPPR